MTVEDIEHCDRPARNMWQNTRGQNIYTCDPHNNRVDAQRVGGPYMTMPNGALVNNTTIKCGTTNN